MITRATLFESFTGRGDELAHLVALRTRACNELRGGTVLVAGDAGIGKSRLLTEFAGAPAPKRSVVLRVRCEENGPAYAPIVWILEELTVRRDVRHSEIEPALQALTAGDAAAGGDPRERQQRRIRAFVAAIGDASLRSGGLTVVIDDAHWSDRSSLEALRALSVSAQRLPLVLVIAYRPDEIASDHTNANAIAAIEREGADRIKLEPLPFGEVARLLHELMPNAPARLLRRIYDLSEGRPYVAEELARSAVEHGGGDAFEATLSLRGAVLERVVRLPKEAREIVDRAAVLGRNFLPGDLLALGATKEQVLAAFRAAFDLQLLEERELDGESWYRFRHALTREILYNDQLSIERRAVHRAIAEHLSESGTRVAELAYHLTAAGDRERATEANERAGDEAAALAAFADASALFDAALANPELDRAALVRLTLKLATSLRHAGDIDELLVTTARDAKRLEGAGLYDDALGLRIVAFRSTDSTRPLVSARILADANAALRPETDPNIRFSVELINARMARKTYRMQDSFAACARAEAALVSPTEEQHCALLLSRANTYLFLNELGDAARMLAERSKYRAEGTAGLIQDAESLAVLSDVTLCRGDIAGAFRMKLDAADRMERVGLLMNSSGFRQSAALPAAYLGDFAFIARHVEQCRRERVDFQDQLAIAHARTARATGTDTQPHVAAFERALEARMPFLSEKLGAELPWMFSDEPARAASLVKQTLDALITFDGLDGDFMESVAVFGSADDLARGLALYESLGPPKSDHLLQQVADAMVRARLAAREHRSIEAVRYATRAATLARETGQWLELAHACAILGDRAAARAEFLRVGAVAEWERLERRTASGGPAITTDAAPRLTAREEQIGRLIAMGLSSREAGERLSIAARTVETHVANLYAKLGIGSRAELVAYFNARHTG